MGWFGSSKEKKPAEDTSWTGKLKKLVEGFRAGQGAGSNFGEVPSELVKSFVAPTVYVILSDGRRQAEEDLHLMAMLMTSPVLRGLKPNAFGALIEEVADHLKAAGGGVREKMAALVEPLPEDLRAPAYAFAVRMVYADQYQTPEEQRALEDLQGWLHIIHTEAERIDRAMRLLVTAPPIS